ncbi:uncharacterized protein METZ01_LOCUS455985 [marine metagenome]|uniref:8-oxo-dGTP diphosphatase n=1 Tax=marine metagenome TaxID=408172 RepID=A0A383A698_9ZZZZ
MAVSKNVVVGLILDGKGRVLVSQRMEGVHMGGFWEFPGGKRRALEGRQEALERELKEELGIQVLEARPLMALKHNYPDRCVCLDVFLVQTYEGRPVSLESQPIAWILPQDLKNKRFLPADKPIIEALISRNECPGWE